MTITDSRHNRRGTGTAKSDNRWAIAFHSQKPFPLCPVRVGRSVRVGPLVESLPPAFKRLQSPARDRGKLQPYSLNSLQAPINKLQQNLRRRITGRSEVVIEFPVVRFFRSKDRRLHSRCF